MGKKTTVIMDQSQEEDLNIRSKNKYKKQDSAFDLPDEFAELAALYEREKQADMGSSEDESSEHNNKKSIKKRKVRSKKTIKIKQKIKKSKKYNLKDAVKTLIELSNRSFDESVEVHIVSKKFPISGKFELPHGTGKSKKVVIFDSKILKQIESQKIDFDVLIAKPEDMKNLAKHARFLGPRGIMPNPKNGTISSDPKKAIKSFTGNLIRYKTEKKAPLLHLIAGKVSFGEDKLIENINTIFKHLNHKTMKKVSICSTMGPGIKIDLDKI